MSPAALLRAILREEAVAYLVESEPGRPLRDACGDAVDALVFFDRRDAEEAVASELDCQPEEMPPLTIVALIRKPEQD